MSQPITDGIYRIDKSGEEYLGSACLSLGFGGSTRIVTMREGDVFEEDHLKWELKYDSAREAYTIQNVSNKLYLSFEGAPETNTELYAGPEASHFEFRPSETTPGRFNIFVKSTDAEVWGSPLMMHPPIMALQAPDSPFTHGERVDWKIIPA